MGHLNCPSIHNRFGLTVTPKHGRTHEPLKDFIAVLVAVMQGIHPGKYFNEKELHTCMLISWRFNELYGQFYFTLKWRFKAPRDTAGVGSEGLTIVYQCQRK